MSEDVATPPGPMALNFLSALLCKVRRGVLGSAVPILTFHRVSDVDNGLWPDMSTSVFDGLMREISQTMHPVLPSELCRLGRRWFAKPLVCVTFDDGYLSFKENALPILERYNIPVLLNVCADLIDRNQLPWPQLLNDYIVNSRGRIVRAPSGVVERVPEVLTEGLFVKMMHQAFDLGEVELAKYIDHLEAVSPPSMGDRLMTWGEILECAARGVLIGNHSASHHNLGKVISEERLAFEVLVSNQRIHSEIGCSPSIFAFPNGLYSECSMRAVERAGFETVLVCNGGLSIAPCEVGRDKFSVCSTVNMGAGPLWKERMRSLGLS